MDDYLKNFIFASNLLEYLFLQYSIPWEIPNSSILKDELQSNFDEEIGLAVYTIWQKNIWDINACFNELRGGDEEVKEYEENVSYEKALRFSKYAVSAADSYFSKGYNPGSFLGYCAIVLGIATYYFEVPSNHVPEIAVGVVALVLMAHQLTGQFYKHDGWDGIRETSLKFNQLPINLDLFESTPEYHF